MAFLQVDYKSKKLGRKAHFNVFLPMDVDPAKTGAPFRTLYLLHGIYGNSTSWVTSSCIQRYADDRNLCVVMPDGENGFYLDHPDYMNNFSHWIGEELVEATRAMLPLSPRWADTWIGGFSMGGYGALRTGLKYADTFGGIIAFSSALLLESLQNRTGTAGPMNEPYARAMFGDLDHLVGTELDPLQLARERVQSGKAFPRLYLSCGEQDFLLADNEKFHQALKDLGVEHAWRTTPRRAHLGLLGAGDSPCGAGLDAGGAGPCSPESGSAHSGFLKDIDGQSSFAPSFCGGAFLRPPKTCAFLVVRGFSQSIQLLALEAP